jgi:hypothetical protein
MPATQARPTPRDGRQRPLVYATAGALAAARRLLPAGVVLEREVAEVISRSSVGHFVFLDEYGVVARCVRTPGRFRPRPRSWTVVAVERNRRQR